MKVRLATLVLLGFLFSLATAQTGADSTRIFKPNSFQFRVYNFISLSSFKGSLISYKYHPSDKTAYRVGVGVRAAKWKEEVSEDRIYTDTTLFDQDLNRSDVTISLMLEYLKYFNIRGDIKIFTGAGPLVSYDIDHSNTADVTVVGDDYNYYEKYNYDHFEFGLTFSYGLEWFFRKNMSLHAEYGFNLTYFHEKFIRNRVYSYPGDIIRLDNQTEKQNGFRLSDRGALLGLSVYF
jgi:hypothetical protein